MKKQVTRFLAAFLVIFTICGAGLPGVSLPSVGQIAVSAATAEVASPTSDQKTGNHLVDGKYLKVNLSCKTSGATIYYKIDDGSYKKYTKTIGVTKNCTIYAYASKGGKKSKTVKFSYTISPNFKLSAYGGNYTTDQLVKVSTKVPGVTFRFTLNGQAVTEKSREFPAEGIKIANTATLKVNAYKDNWTTVGYTQTYNINKLGTYRYYYYQLSDMQKIIYNRIDKAVKNKETFVDLKDLGLELNEIRGKDFDTNFDCARLAYFYDNYFYDLCTFSLVGTSTLATGINIDYSKTLSNEKLKKLEEKADKIVAKAMEQPTAYGKLKYIHDWIAKNAYFKETGEAGSAYRVIVEGYGVCGDYSRAFCYLAQRMGFDCIYVQRLEHAWNKVKINGAWYNVDVIQDDIGTEAIYDGFLKSDNDKKFGEDTDHAKTWGMDWYNVDAWFTYPDCKKDYAA